MDPLSAPSLAEGSVWNVPFVNESGLREDSTVRFMVREEVAALWSELDRSSCLLEGPPGCGKSTAVWFWLLRRVKQTGQPAVWVHLSKLEPATSVYITLNKDGTLSFETSVPGSSPFDRDFSSTPVGVCVVDGVTEENRKDVINSWRVFGPKTPQGYKDCHMIWVSSQQVVIGKEHFKKINMERRTHFTWTNGEILQYAKTFGPEEQQQFVADVVAGTPPGRLMPTEQVTFEQALNIKMYYFGDSARWLFGLTMKEALEDVTTFIEAIDNVKILQAGLHGARSARAVNHVIAMDRSHTPESSGTFKIASTFIIEKLTAALGLEAIRVMYASPWVRGNPSVHGFVFEWDVLTRLEHKQEVLLVDSSGNKWPWAVDSTLRLSKFDSDGMVGDRLLVYPEKWNNPEYDGLFIHRSQDSLHFVAWNASEAMKHSGSVAKLLLQLEHWSQRPLNQINFVTVRFLFLVPIEHLPHFKLPTDSACLAAKKHLCAWSFQGFEVYGTSPSR